MLEPMANTVETVNHKCMRELTTSVEPTLITWGTSSHETLGKSESGSKQSNKLRKKPDLTYFGEKNHVEKTVSRNNTRAYPTDESTSIYMNVHMSTLHNRLLNISKNNLNWSIWKAG